MVNTMKTPILLLALLFGFLPSSDATVSGPDNIVYGTIMLSGAAVTSANTNIFVAARLQPDGPPIATYTMGWLPSAGNYYSLRISVESVGSVLAPNAVQAGQLVYVDVDDSTGIRIQSSLKIGAPGQATLLNFGSSTSAAPSDALSVNLVPAAAVSAGAQWQVDGGSNQNSGLTISDLSAGSHTVSFTPIAGWNTPEDQVVTVTANAVTTVIGLYTLANTPTTGLVLVTNGYGSILGAPANPINGKRYTLKAVPDAGNVFVNWVGGPAQPYSVLKSSASFTFNYESYLLLVANFATNIFLEAGGTYTGLFAPTNAARQQNNSGAFTFTLHDSGAASGTLTLGSQTVPFSGKFNLDGAMNFVSKATRSAPSLTLALQLNLTNPSVSGSVSDSAFTASLSGNRDVFSKTNNATDFAGQYTLVIPGTSNASVGPFGNSYGTVKVSSTGAITLSGSLADGTAISQTSEVSQDGYWPLYINLYGGKGSLWGWNYFTNHTLTNSTALSWINATNTAKKAVYRSGFTNQTATLSGMVYQSGQTLPTGLNLTLQDASLFGITITNLADNTNKLTLKTNAATGAISGSFANPADPDQTIKFNGVILQGQTNAQGYFLGTNHSGAFLLESP